MVDPGGPVLEDGWGWDLTEGGPLAQKGGEENGDSMAFKEREGKRRKMGIAGGSIGP